MMDDCSPLLLLKIEFTTQGTHISFNKEGMNFTLNSEENHIQALSALSLLNIFVDSKGFEKEMKKFAKTFDIETLESKLALLEDRSSIH